MAEPIRIRTLSDLDREAIASWRYPGELAIYDPGSGAAELRAPDHVALVSPDGTLLGYGSLGRQGQVPGGRYDGDAIDLGMGLRPDLVGRGLGPAALSVLIDYAKRDHDRVRVTVADANPRAGALVRDLGFAPSHRFARASDGRAFTQFEHDEDSDRVAAFIADGYWPVRGAIDPDEPRLLSICDRLIGPGRRHSRSVRSPSAEDPEGTRWTSVLRRERGLLLLVLLSDADEACAPSELIVGSHLDVPPLLEPDGESGTPFDAAWLPASTFERPRVLVTGSAGDVFVCHPFLVHRATRPKPGTRPRALARSEIALDPPLSLQPRPDLHPVEHAICKALRR